MWINTNHTMGYVVPIILSQIAEVLSQGSQSIISLIPTGTTIILTEKGYSVEIEDVDIPCDLISVPNPKYPNDEDGSYRVNHVYLGGTIIEDTMNGFPFNKDEIKRIVKGEGKWAFYG